jgi:hypothetical protein
MDLNNITEVDEYLRAEKGFSRSEAKAFIYQFKNIIANETKTVEKDMFTTAIEKYFSKK